jgi:hypothetical protein
VHWCVEVTGDSIALQALEQSMRGEATSIARQSEKFVLTSDTFLESDSAREVASKARAILSRLSAAARVTLGSEASLSVGGVYRVRDDGLRDYFLLAEPAQFRLRGIAPTIIVTRSDGSEEVSQPGDTAARWERVAQADGAVQKALRLRDREALGWVDLYRLYEVIEADVGRNAIVAKGWARDSQIREFRHTANSVSAAGDDARHGHERIAPPARPMTIAAAKELIDAVLTGWVNDKAAKLGEVTSGSETTGEAAPNPPT